MSVQVAVRVRPFNQREKDIGCSLVVDMQGNTTKLVHPEDSKKNKEYTFDYSFWSHDEFELNEEGQAIPTGDRYADQRQVYETVGTQILDNAWAGYNCCLFAYGQTGAGKSYSMVGYKPNIGIVPIACQEIFKRIESTESDNVSYEVFCSMVEIYNEKVQDLLVPTSKRPPGGLKIRENKAIGFYVDNITKYPVESYGAIEQIMDDGSKNRTIASTQMNACSSRAHTIITIEFKCIEQNEIKKIEKSSVINLVDLAGSEKVGKTGASGDRLKEAGQINKSLSTLGLVISTIVDIQNGKAGKVPYRDSCLTKILANALGGNSKTLMICAISPAHDNYEETLSTLRYADQAKKIKNKAIINESATDKLIRELSKENEELKKKMELFDQIMIKFKMEGNLTPNQMMKAMGEQFDQMMQVKEDLQANDALMNNAAKNFEQKVVERQETENQIHFKKIDLNKPYLTNLNEDPILTKKVQYQITEQGTQIGRKKGNPVPDIVLNSVEIKDNHAIITSEGDKVYLSPYDEECGNNIFLNGQKIFEKTELKNQDRIVFGNSSAFLMIIPEGQPRQDNLPNNIDWEFAQEEKNNENGKQRKEDEEELLKQQELIHQQEIGKYQKTIDEREAIQRVQEEEYRKKVELLEKERQEQDRIVKEQENKLKSQKEDRDEFVKVKQELERQRMEKEKKNKIKEKNNIEHKLHKILPRIVEVNLFSKELKRNIQLQAKLGQAYTTDSENPGLKVKKLQIQIQVFNREEGTVYMWDSSKFTNRYYIIKDLLDKYFETNEIPILSKGEDPFWDPPEQQLIGEAYLKLLSLGYLMDNPSNVSIVGDSGQQGTLKVNVIPTDPTGEVNLGEDMMEEADMIEDPSELIDKKLHYLVVIQSAQFNKRVKNVFVEYTVFDSLKQEQQFKTEMVKERSKDDAHVFNYKQLHIIEKVDHDIVDYLQHQNIGFKIYAEEELSQEAQQLAQQKAAAKPKFIHIKNAVEEVNEEQLQPSDLFMNNEQLKKYQNQKGIDFNHQYTEGSDKSPKNNLNQQVRTLPSSVGHENSYQGSSTTYTTTGSYQPKQQSHQQQQQQQQQQVNKQQDTKKQSKQKDQKKKNGNCSIF